MKTYEFTIEGIEVTVLPSSHANDRLEERGLTGYQVSGALMAMGEDILDMKDKTEFMIIDEALNAAYVFVIHAEKSGDICIDVKTVIDKNKLFIKQGTQVLRLVA